jgi:Ala-tRNA(Pro) deacylase
MAVGNLKTFLEKEGVNYTTIHHSRAYTAMETAESAHVKGKEMAKSVVLKVDGKLAMAVLPATQKVHVERLRKATGAVRVEIAREHDFQGDFPGCEVGAMPPFGNLYGMEVFVDSHLAEDEEIAFNAGSHTELMSVHYRDFERLVHPKTLSM